MVRMTYTIETVKGRSSGTLHDVCTWQAEHQGAYATLVMPSGETVDVSGIEFNAEEIETTMDEVRDQIGNWTECPDDEGSAS